MKKQHLHIALRIIITIFILFLVIQLYFIEEYKDYQLQFTFALLGVIIGGILLEVLLGKRK